MNIPQLSHLTIGEDDRVRRADPGRFGAFVPKREVAGETRRLMKRLTKRMAK